MVRLLKWLLGVVVICTGAGLYLTMPGRIGLEDLPDRAGDPAAGALVFAAGGCASCHAAPGAEGDAKLSLAGGLELKTDFGTFVVPNISPHPDNGIGGWTVSDFATAMLKGTRPDGAHYYPSFPYPSYARMDVDDVVDLKAYMDTLPPSDTANRDHDLGFPFSIRRGLGLWKRLYLSSAAVVVVGNDDQIRRGRALVEGAGHCGECHTPRNMIGGPDYANWLAGGPNPEGKGRIPNITPHDDGLADWTVEDIAYYLETGFTPDFDSAGGSMTDVISNISELPAEDRAAIAAYLKAVPPVANN